MVKLKHVVFSHGKESGPMGGKIKRLMAEAERYGLKTTVQTYLPRASKVEIVHGINDETVPYENSIRFATEQKETILHLVPDDHRLKASLDFLACQFRRFIEEMSFSEQ